MPNRLRILSREGPTRMEFSDGGHLLRLSWKRSCVGSHPTWALPVLQGDRQPEDLRWHGVSGTGAVPPVREPTQLCPGCEGRAYELSSGLECLDCRGRGVITSWREETQA